MNKKVFPNWLTAGRGILTLIIIALFFISCPDKYVWILILFIIACLTDFFDGILARRWKVISNFGKMFDPLFDKILTISLYFLLMPLFGQWLGLLFILLILRELIIDGIKNYMLAKGEVTPAIVSAKIKTSSQMLMLTAALAYLTWPLSWILQLTYALGVLAVIMAYYSGLIYFKKFLKFYK